MAQPLTNTMELPCLLKVGDNITTDHIMPAGEDPALPQQYPASGKLLL
ncbi:MAG: hypothetical protein ACLRRT_11555 [Ruthenibacterium lactatiformans]